jgi:hypothetical protein
VVMGEETTRSDAGSTRAKLAGPGRFAAQH